MNIVDAHVWNSILLPILSYIENHSVSIILGLIFSLAILLMFNSDRILETCKRTLLRQEKEKDTRETKEEGRGRVNFERTYLLW